MPSEKYLKEERDKDGRLPVMLLGFFILTFAGFRVFLDVGPPFSGTAGTFGGFGGMCSVKIGTVMMLTVAGVGREVRVMLS
jgi:hypothetical protein